MQKYNGRRPVFNFGRLILHFCNSLQRIFLIGTTLTTEPLGGFPGNTRGRSRAPVKFPYPIVRVYVQAYKQIQHCQSLLNIPEPTAAVAAVKEHYYLCLITCCAGRTFYCTEYSVHSQGDKKTAAVRSTGDGTPKPTQPQTVQPADNRQSFTRECTTQGGPLWVNNS